MSQFLLNQQVITPSLPAYSSLLTVIRQQQGLMGAKDGCHTGDCGACLILLGRLINGQLYYQTVNACLLPLVAVTACHIVTIEGIETGQLNPIQQALVTNGAIQCGFCSSGLVMALLGFFLTSERSDEVAAVDAVAGNLCRCTGYAGIKRAIAQLCDQFDLSRSPITQRIQELVAWQFLPCYFLTIAKQLPHGYSCHTGSLLIAGGTDLLVQQPRCLHTEPLHYLANKSEPIHIKDQLCLIPATISIEQLRTSPVLQTLLPNVADDFKLIASAPIRHRATLGGNLVNASPIADLAITFLALDAKLITNNRTLALKDFFLAYKQVDLQPNEQLQTVSFNTETAQYFSFEKVSKRQYLDIASVNSALSIEQQDKQIIQAHLAAGGVAPIPLYLSKTSDFLIGKTINADTVLNAVSIAETEISPISDTRGSAAYKRLLFRQLLLAHFLKLFPETLCWDDLYVR
jgi:xanthine dehydrogenase small subunit